MTIRTPLFAAVAVLALAACSQDSPEQDAAAAAAEARNPPDSAGGAAQIRQALTEEDIQGAALIGELGCAFTQRGAAGPLLVAMADVTDEARANGVLRLGSLPVRLSADAAGGFNAMVRGVRFTSGDLEARVVVTSQTPTGGGESPPFPALLEIVSNAGSEAIVGEWACGP